MAALSEALPSFTAVVLALSVIFPVDADQLSVTSRLVSTLPKVPVELAVVYPSAVALSP